MAATKLEEIKRRRAAHRNRKSSVANLPIECEGEGDNDASKLPKKKPSCVYNAELTAIFRDGTVVIRHVRYTPLSRNACKLELSLRTAYVIPGETFESDNHPSWATSSNAVTISLTLLPDVGDPKLLSDFKGAELSLYLNSDCRPPCPEIEPCLPDKLDLEDGSLLVSIASPKASPKSQSESFTKSKTNEAADVTLTTVGLSLFEDEMSDLHESIDDAQKNCSMIEVPTSFPDDCSYLTKDSARTDEGDEVAECNFDFRNIPEFQDVVVQSARDTKETLETVKEGFDNVGDRQSKHFWQTIDGQRKSDRNQMRMLQWMEDQTAMQKAALMRKEDHFEEKVNAEVARRMAHRRETTKTTAPRPRTKSSFSSVTCITDKSSAPFKDTTNIPSLNRPKKLTIPKGPDAYQKWKKTEGAKNAARARKDESRRLQAPGRKLPWG